MALVNIPRDIKDEFHRYKMPALIAKVEGRGNGIKTVIVNMADIAKALERPPEYVTKYFGIEFGALITVDVGKERYIVNGKHDKPKLDRALDAFIDRFVLCKKCTRNPETKMILKGGTIELSCKACGNRSPVDMRQKLASYILKNPPSELASNGGTPVATGEKKKKDKKSKESNNSDDDGGDNGANGDEPKSASKRKKKSEEEQDEVVWFTDTSKEAAEERRRAMLEATSELAAKLLSSGVSNKDKADAMDLLQKFVSKDPSNEQVVSELNRVKEEEKWDEEQTASIVFVVLFGKDILKQLKARMSVIKEFTKNRKAQQGILVGIEELCGVREVSLLPSVPHILKALYDEDVLEEEVLLAWHSHKSKGTIAKVKDAGKVFVDWLRNAEEESEGDEEDDDEEDDDEEEDDNEEA